MPEVIAVASLALLIVAVVLLVLVIIRQRAADQSAVLARLDGLDRVQERGERALREEAVAGRQESARQAQDLRRELQASLKGANDTLVRSLGEMGKSQHDRLGAVVGQLGQLTESNRKEIEALRANVEAKLAQIQESSGKKLDQMRQIVDEKLQATLQQRLGEQFKIVSDRLQEVHKGLGEMQELAAGVGDLKKVFANVRTRGTWGEMQLGALLEQILAPEQYAQNYSPRANAEKVEYAIRLPGRDPGQDAPVHLPIDAKFPLADYQRLVEAAESGDIEAVEAASKNLEAMIRSEARMIAEKYIEPPQTTDFAVMYLPSEALYAEVLRRPGLADALRRDWRVIVAGPTTFAALLSSLQMGFRTLAIEKRSSEVWQILGAVKTEFNRFEDVLGKMRKKVQELSNQMDSTSTRTRVMSRKLREVEALPEARADQLLGTGEAGAAEEDEGEG